MIEYSQWVTVNSTVVINADYFFQSCLNIFNFSIWQVKMSDKNNFPLLFLSFVYDTGRIWSVYIYIALKPVEAVVTHFRKHMQE